MEALKRVAYPGFSRDIVSFGLVRQVAVEDSTVKVTVSLTTTDERIPEQLKTTIENTVQQLDGVEAVDVVISLSRPKGGAQKKTPEDESQLKEVDAIVAIASGKGGVGKSTLAVNIACALSRLLPERSCNKGVGLMDCDVYGPSVPLMLGIQSKPEIDGDLIRPQENYGVKAISMGLLVDENTPVVWRGPMVTSAIGQFARNVSWGALDILVVDLPPGTGDAQLALTQTMSVNGAVIVTTPRQRQ